MGRIPPLGAAVEVKGLFIAQTIAELASWFNGVDPIVGATYIEKKPEMTAPLVASIFNHDNLSASKAASILDNANLSVSKAASILDNANLSASKAASILDSAELSVAKLADIFGHSNLSNSKATSIFNLMTRAIADLAQVFDDIDVPASKAAYVVENTTKTVADLASIFDNANLSADKAASIFDDANLSADKVAVICDDPNISSAKLKAILDSGKLTDADKLAAILDGKSLTADDAATHIESSIYTDDLYASAFDSPYLSADKAASIFNSMNLSASKAASILDNANLSASKLQAILDNTNLSIQKGQEIVDAMSNPEKIGIGGRRGIIGDDWEDNKLTNRDKAAVVATTLDKIFQIFRPEWNVISAPTVSGGIVNFEPADNDQISIAVAIPDEFTLEYRARHAESGYDGNFGIHFWHQDSDNYFMCWAPNMRLPPEGLRLQYKLIKVVGGSETEIIAYSADPDTNWHTIKLTRDANGNYELFVDGKSVGTGSDTWIPTKNEFRIRAYSCANNRNAEIAWIKVY